MIRTRRLSYTYAGAARPALHDVDVEFLRGQLTLLAGPSGSGKSTLARCLNGLIPRSVHGGALTGRIEIDGVDAAPLSLAALGERIGTVLQDPEKQIVAADVLGDIAFGPENLGLPRDEIRRRASDAAAQLGIAHLLTRRTVTLSGGEKQKVALAGVLAMQPAALLLDEPLASLDPPSADDAMRLLRRLADAGSAVIVVEHRLGVVRAVQPEQTLFLEDGRIVSPPPDEVETPPPPRRRTPGEPLVELRDVHFGYAAGRSSSNIRGVRGLDDEQPQSVLRGVNLTIRAGERIALLGANGSGKSTLCRHLIGLHRPTAGEVRVGGRNAAEMTVAEIARIVGYVFQSPSAMLFAPTLRQELAFGPRNVGYDERRIAELVARAAESMGLHDRLDESPFALSFGGRKRASVAAVLAMGPRVLVLDEPTAGQDAASVQRLLRAIDDAESVDAVLIATHDLALARTWADRVLILQDGALRNFSESSW